MMKPGLLVLVLLAAAPGDEGAPFSPPWDDAAPGPTDLAATLHRPAGSLGPVAVRDGRLWTGDRRIRFWGANFTAGACFPSREDAPKIAARLAKLGMNAVRLHFLDATWGQPRLVDYASGDWTRWNADALDRLDYFVKCLKDQGVYVNLNLLVGRRFGTGDGVDPGVNRLDWKAAHAPGFFHGPHLAAQKEYARKLLSHRNPHTRLTYAEDPAVAFVEINNENGLIHTWMGGGFEGLPDPFAADLGARWNAWLAGRHADDRALAAAWHARREPPGPELLANPGFARGLEGWTLERHQGAQAQAAARDGILEIRVPKAGTEGWHVQFNQSGLKIVRGGIYTATLRASADRPRKVSVSTMQAHEPWGGLGLQASIDLDREPRRFRWTFVASADDENARFGLSNLSQEGAQVSLSELSLRPGGTVGLAEGESLAGRSIGVPSSARGREQTPEARLDWIRFLWETERAHWREMGRFLREDLGVKGLVIGTIVGCSTPTLMADLDAVDTHAYWEHPRFPRKQWDPADWIVRPRSMTDFPAEATTSALARARVAGKPHVVSEYNHPAPNPHAGEGPLLLAAAACLQDWDALFLYTYAHDEGGVKAGRIPGFFDVGQHPTIIANAQVASLLFRRGDLAPAARRTVVPLAPEREIRLVAEHGAAWQVFPSRSLGLDPLLPLESRIELDLSAPASKSEPAVQGPPGPAAGFSWRQDPPGRGLLEVRTPRTKLAIGRADGRTLDLGDGVGITIGSTRNGWCTAALTLTQGEAFGSGPARALLVLAGEALNTGMAWTDAGKTSVGREWGRAPSLVEVVEATLRLPRRAGAGLPKGFALDERGQRGGPVEVVEAGPGAAELRLGRASRTIWYEIELP